MDIPIKKMQLMDGRTLAWAEYGDPDGLPVLFLHSAGHSLIEGAYFDKEAKGSGVRVIAPSRPGAWHSSPQPNRTLLGFAADCVELMDHLHIPRFVVSGNSNGGAFAMAVAHALPGRTIAAVPINATSPIWDRRVWRLAPTSLKLLMLTAKYTSRWSARMTRAGLDNPRAREQLIPPGTEPEIAELIAQSIARVDDDCIVPEVRIMSRPWGFDHRAVRCPVRIVYAEHDTSRYLGDTWARELPDAKHITLPGGHVPTSLAARRLLVSTWLELGRAAGRNAA